MAPVLLAALALHSPAPPFVARDGAVSRSDVRWSWHPGCPVGPAQLRKLRVSYWGFDGERHLGVLVVHAGVARDVLKVFGTLYRAHFRIRRMEPVDAFRGSDEASMAADNTSAFNCRYAVASGAKRWSAHAYGQAIDVNPVENPYVEGGRVRPGNGKAFLDRSDVRAGMAVAGGTLVRAFGAAGWSWGGRWASTPDYQHFSSSGG